jgi:arsenate reductase (glutaredoxin)
MDVLLLGHPKSQITRKAKRFFSERRVPVHERDLRKRALTPGELRRWVQRYGVEALIDTESKPYRDQGLQYLGADPDAWEERLVADPLLIRLPLVRVGDVLSVGDDVDAWHEIAEAAREGA